MALCTGIELVKWYCTQNQTLSRNLFEYVLEDSKRITIASIHCMVKLYILLSENEELSLQMLFFFYKEEHQHVREFLEDKLEFHDLYEDDDLEHDEDENLKIAFQNLFDEEPGILILCLKMEGIFNGNTTKEICENIKKSQYISDEQQKKFIDLLK